MLINTGWHRRYSDSQEYFGHAPGLSKKAAEWLVKKKVKLVGVDTACVDHPLATSLGPHRNGPQIKYLLPEYKKATGRDAIKDFPEWNAAHKVLLGAGIPTIENVGGDLDELSGKRCTFQGFPWKWHEGDACVIRLVAILDPKGKNRLESGEMKKPAVKSSNGVSGKASSSTISPTAGATACRNGRRAPTSTCAWSSSTPRTACWCSSSKASCIAAPTWTRRSMCSENQPTLTGYPLWRFFGTGVVVSIPKKKWGVITPKDLENAEPKIQKNDIVMINTGSHNNYGDNPDYFAYSPGLYKEAAEWIVERGVKLVGIDVQALDHPLGTFLGPHGPGPAQPHLDDEYFAETGRHIIDDFPHWEPAHKIMMTNGIPGIENIGGDIDKITGKRCTFFAFPWRWPDGEGCALRVVAVLDPTQAFRFETGK